METGNRFFLLEKGVNEMESKDEKLALKEGKSIFLLATYCGS